MVKGASESRASLLQVSLPTSQLLGATPLSLIRRRSVFASARAISIQPTEDWASRKREGAEEAWSTAQRALKRVGELLDAGKTADAQRAALTMAILVDKSGVLELAAEQADERQVAITQQQGELLAEVMWRVLADLGLPSKPGTPVAKLIAHHLRSHGEEPAPESDVEAAKREVRRALDLDCEEPRVVGPVPQIEAGKPPEPPALLAKTENRTSEPAAKPQKGEARRS